jgi:hypothetical protein
MNELNIRRYRGRLAYGRGAYLDFQSFIVRQESIGFAAVSIDSHYGPWEIESGKPAILMEDGTYWAKGVYAQQRGTRADGPWDISFKIDYEDMGVTIEVSGMLAADGKIYEFIGELDAIK